MKKLSTIIVSLLLMIAATSITNAQSLVITSVSGYGSGGSAYGPSIDLSSGSGWADVSVTPSNFNYTYKWSYTAFDGESVQIYPNYTNGPDARVYVWAPYPYYGGSVKITCDIYNGTTLIGQVYTILVLSI